MMTLVKAIPLPLFILILSAFSIALFRYAIYAYKTKNRDAFLPVLVAAFGGPIAIFSRCIYDYFPTDSGISKVSFIISVIFIIIIIIVLYRMIWRRYKRGAIGKREKSVILISICSLIFAVLGFSVIFILMILGI